MSSEPATTLVLIVTAIMTFMAFGNAARMERWLFKPHDVLVFKQFDRMLTSGFIHGDWMHFAFNAISLFSFGSSVERNYGPWTFLAVYFASIVGGSVLSLWIHRHHDYRALGASGGVCGVIFASIFLLPGTRISMFFLPVGIPAFVYAICFLLFSFFAQRRGSDNVGHDAHLGGAIVGLLTATALYPSMIAAQPWMFASVLGLSVIIMGILVKDPWHLLERRLDFGKGGPGVEEKFRDYDYNRDRNRKISEIDRLLDKVSIHGVQSLSESERKKLDRLSKEMRGGS